MKKAIFIKFKVTPGCGKTEFLNCMTDGTVKVSLKAPPVDGKANLELIRWLAKEFCVNKSFVSIKSGNTSRRKLVKIYTAAVFPHWYHG